MIRGFARKLEIAAVLATAILSLHGPAAAACWQGLIDRRIAVEKLPGAAGIRSVRLTCLIEASGTEIWDAVAEFWQVLQRSHEQPEARLTWKRLSGDLKRIRRSWAIKVSPRAHHLRNWIDGYPLDVPYADGFKDTGVND